MKWKQSHKLPHVKSPLICLSKGKAWKIVLPLSCKDIFQKNCQLLWKHLLPGSWLGEEDTRAPYTHAFLLQSSYLPSENSLGQCHATNDSDFTILKIFKWEQYISNNDKNKTLNFSTENKIASHTRPLAASTAVSAWTFKGFSRLYSESENCQCLALFFSISRNFFFTDPLVGKQ